MTVITRFAPSPTGFLHIGGARTALELARPIVEADERAARGEHVGEISLSGAVCALCSFDLGARLPALLRDNRKHRLGVVAIEP